VRTHATFRTSRALVESNRGVLVATRRRIATCRRQLNRAFGLSGGSAAPDLRETVRALLAKGLLAPVRDTVLAGHGSGKICAVCGLPIAPNDVEYEVEGLPRPTRCHVACFVAWRDESRRVTSPDQ